jgi:hypothetical protein
LYYRRPLIAAPPASLLAIFLEGDRGSGRGGPGTVADLSMAMEYLPAHGGESHGRKGKRNQWRRTIRIKISLNVVGLTSSLSPSRRDTWRALKPEDASLGSSEGFEMFSF